MPYLYANPMPRRAMGSYVAPTRRISPAQRLRTIPRRLRGLRGLGDTSTPITPQEAFTQAISATGYGPLNPRDFQNQSFLNASYAAVQAGQFDINAISPACAGIIKQNPDLSLTQAVGKVAGGVTGTLATVASGAAGAALGVATLGIGVVVAVLSMIFAHHAQAVAVEQQTECTASAAANNAMNVLAEGVASGQIKPADAATALNTLYSQFVQMTSPAFGTSPYCNANCELRIGMKAMVLYWQGQYNAIAEAQASTAAAQAASVAASTPTAAQVAANPLLAITAPAQNAVASVAASTGLPSWVIYLGGAFLLYELVS